MMDDPYIQEMIGSAKQFRIRPRVDPTDWYGDSLASAGIGDRVPTGRMLTSPRDRSPSMGKPPTPGAGDFDPRYKPTRHREKESHTKAAIVVVAGIVIFALLFALKK